ncbi:MAG: major capsid protein [Synergistaceae bacterium]|jgi:hypothetical protein|nr:major capsid protein [Synergistaceae bacterium]
MANPSIFDSFTPDALAAYIEVLSKQEEQNYITRPFFPTVYTADLEMSYLKAKVSLPAAIRPSSFDSEPSLRSPSGFREIIKEIPFFREAYFVGEKEYKELVAIYKGDKAAKYGQEILNNFYEDGTNLYSGAQMQLEAMRMQLLSKGGKITIGDGAAAYSADFEMPSQNLFMPAPGKEWSNTATAEIIKDIRAWREAMQNGPGKVLPTILMMNLKTWNYILDNEIIARGIYDERNIRDGAALADGEVRDYIQKKLYTGVVGYRPLTFMVIDNGYYPHLDSGFVPYFDDGKVALLPGDAPLGNTYWSDTPEADIGSTELNTGKFTMRVMEDSGITICQSISDTPPMRIKTWLSMIAMPSFPQVDKCGLATVA